MSNLNGDIVVITGGSGMLGSRYMQAVQEIGGYPVNLDLFPNRTDTMDGDPYYNLKDGSGEIHCDISKEEDVQKALSIIKRYLAPKPIYGLINNAAIDPKFQKDSVQTNQSRLENYSLDQWNKEIAVGLTGSFLCTKYFAPQMLQNHRGSIINISSVLGLISPNQGLYELPDTPEELQPVKPVTYSCIKSGIIGLTRYVSSYYAKKGIRCNAICPGPIYNNHSQEFMDKLCKLIPMNRMGDRKELCGLVKFLLSEESSFMTSAIIPIDGGMSGW